MLVWGTALEELALRWTDVAMARDPAARAIATAFPASPTPGPQPPHGGGTSMFRQARGECSRLEPGLLPRASSSLPVLVPPGH